jgi:hypothetical protein
MKNRFLFFLVLFISLFAFSNSAFCKDRDGDINFNYEFTVTNENEPVANAEILCITKSDKEVLLRCDKRGHIKYETNDPIAIAVGMIFGYSGVLELNDDGIITIPVQSVPQASAFSTMSIGTFVVYSTDGNGDVSFRYQGTFIRYYCTSWLPYLGISTDPNAWSGWVLTNWLPTWKGKKLLVPTRYQTYHKTAYGYSISSALFLESNL